MPTEPTVSVLMPVQNARRYIEEAIESVLGQTFGDFEFLIIDDGSTDSSLEILKQYAARTARIRLTGRPKKGLAATLNELIDKARGELIARMDADDVTARAVSAPGGLPAAIPSASWWAAGLGTAMRRVTRSTSVLPWETMRPTFRTSRDEFLRISGTTQSVSWPCLTSFPTKSAVACRADHSLASKGRRSVPFTRQAVEH